MFRNANNWHLSILVIAASVLSLLLIQQSVFAQWEDPIGLPGESTNFRLLVNPLAEDLLTNGHDIIGDNLKIDANGQEVIQIENGGKICFNGTGDCAATWPVVLWDNSNSPDIFYNNGDVGIGTSVPAQALHLSGSGSEEVFLAVDSKSSAYASQIEFRRGVGKYAWLGPSTPSVEHPSGSFDIWSEEGGPILFGIGSNRKMTINSNGYVGIGDIDPEDYLEIKGDEPTGSVNLRLINETGQDSGIFFRGYGGSTDDFKIQWSGRNAGLFDNWLQFWGRSPSQHGDRPVMTMQRDYDPSNGVYNGVGIGVPELEQVDATLRVQNFGSEDIFQLYGDDAEVFSVADNGDTVVDGNLGVVSNNDTTHNYIQLDVKAGGPNSADCDSSSEIGRMIQRTDYNKIYICTAGGWDYFEF